MQPLAEREEEQDPVWYTTSLLVDGRSQSEGNEVQKSVDLLTLPEISPRVCKRMQESMDIHMACGVPAKDLERLDVLTTHEQ